MKILLRSVAAFIAITVLAVIAQAQNRTYTNQYTFGDSLSDNGNAFAASGGAAPGGAPYYNGRWSNGSTFAERLGNTLAVGVTAPTSVKSSMDFAFGGATAVAAVSAVPFPPLPTQLQLFQSHAVTVQRTDLFTVWMGANDVLNTMQAPTTPYNPAAMDVAGVNAAQATTGAVQTLIGLGAKNIVVLNLPDIGATSAVASTGGAAFATRGSIAYNNEFDTRLAPIAAGATDVTLVRIDVRGIFQKLINDYKSFGYTGLVLPVAAASSTDSPYVFFVDGLHPSAKTHALLAAVITESLNPEPVVGFATTEGTAALALESLAASAIDSRAAQLAVSSRPIGRADAYVSFNYGNGDRATDGARPKFDYSARVVTTGVDVRVTDGLVFGGAIYGGQIDAKLGGTTGSFSISDNAARLYAVWHQGQLALTLDGDYGDVRVKNIHRTTALGGLQTNGKSDGTHWGAGLKAVWTINSGSFTTRPWLSLRTEKVNLNAYSEQDVPSLAMAMDAQDAESTAGSAGIDFGTDSKIGDRTLHYDFSGAWHGELGSRLRNVSGKLANNFTRSTVLGVKDGDGSGIALGVAATLSLGKTSSATLGYTADIRSNDKLASRAVLSLQTGF